MEMLTQKVSVCSGSRTVKCPATPAPGDSTQLETLYRICCREDLARTFIESVLSWNRGKRRNVSKGASSSRARSKFRQIDSRPPSPALPPFLSIIQVPSSLSTISSRPNFLPLQPSKNAYRKPSTPTPASASYTFSPPPPSRISAALGRQRGSNGPY